MDLADHRCTARWLYKQGLEDSGFNKSIAVRLVPDILGIVPLSCMH